MPDGDLAWQAAVGGTITEEDFQSFSGCLNDFPAGRTTVSTGLQGIGGTVGEVEVFNGVFGAPPGTVCSRSLLNRDCGGVVHSEITLDFFPPVRGFGTWVFDDFDGLDQIFQMEVTLSNGQRFTSPVLNGNVSGGVEGFIGVVSAELITNVTIQDMDILGGPSTAFFELDHCQVAVPRRHIRPTDVIPLNGGAVGYTPFLYLGLRIAASVGAIVGLLRAGQLAIHAVGTAP